ncbi:MAG: peptidoglycan-binding protein [Elainellaceae cyanobacterium]
MELLALTHAATAYEDPRPEPQLRSLDEFNIQLPSSTWMGLAGFAVAASVVGHTPNANAVVGPGDICPPVSDVQQALLDAGFSPGGVDGIYGVGTTAAVQNFQSLNGLAIDGVVGPSTADALGLGDAGDPGNPFLIGNSCEGGGIGGGSDVIVAAAGGVNVREAPGFTRIIGFAGSGESLSLTGERVFSGGYNWVKLAGEAGWVAEEFLSFGGGDGGFIGGGYEGPATVSTASGLGVNVRSSPDGFRAYGLPDGAVVDLTGVYSDSGGFRWAALSDGNWVASEFLATGVGTPGGTTGGGGIFFGSSGTRVISTLSGLGINVRDTPDGVVLYGLDDGATVFLTGRYSFEGGFQWAEVSGGGWVATDYLI